MGYGCSIEQRQVKREIWKVNTRIKYNKQTQRELITKIEELEISIEKVEPIVKNFLRYQLEPLRDLKQKLTEKLQELILIKIELKKSYKYNSNWILKKVEA